MAYKSRMAYVDSQMARLQARNDDATSNSRFTHKTNSQEGRDYKPFPDREPAALGKIHEIDLGPDITSRNIAMTEAATKRLHGDQSDQPAEESQTQGKMRLGKDGKPRRPRKRRGSDDVRRDEMVDALLRENRRKLDSRLTDHLLKRQLLLMLSLCSGQHIRRTTRIVKRAGGRRRQSGSSRPISRAIPTRIQGAARGAQDHEEGADDVAAAGPRGESQERSAG